MPHALKKTRTAHLTFAALFILPFSVASAKLTDSQVLRQVYSGIKSPKGFYTESGGSSLLHERSGNSYACARDMADARALMRASQARSSVRRKEVSARETGLFYELKVVDVGNPEFVLLDRSFKCSTVRFQGTSVPRQTIEAYNARVANLSPDSVNPGSATKLVEYLWYISNYNMSGSAVLETQFTEKSGEYVFTIWEAHTVFGDWGINDSITLVKSVYRTNKISGVVTVESLPVRKIKGRHNPNPFGR